VAQAVAETGDHARAESVARTIIEPTLQASALASLADSAAAMGEMECARRLVARLLAAGNWTSTLHVLARLDHAALDVITEECSTS